MDAKVAKKLNELLIRMKDPLIIKVHPTTSEVIGGSTDERLAIRDEINAAYAAVYPFAVEAEIRAAAAQKRECLFVDARTFFQDGHDRKGAATMAASMIAKVLVDAPKLYNDAAEARYEAYRLACEQGVAVAPTCAS